MLLSIITELSIWTWLTHINTYLKYLLYQVLRQSKCGSSFFVQWISDENFQTFSAYAKMRTISVIPADEHNNNRKTTYITFSGFIVYPKDCVRKRNFVVDVNELATLAPSNAEKLAKVYAVMDEYVKKREADAYTYCSPLSSRTSSLSSASANSTASTPPGLTDKDIQFLARHAETEESLTLPDVEALREAVAEDVVLQQRVLEEYPETVTGSSFSSGFEHEMTNAAEGSRHEQEHKWGPMWPSYICSDITIHTTAQKHIFHLPLQNFKV